MEENTKVHTKAHVEVTLKTGETDYIWCATAQMALISALTLTTSKTVMGNLVNIAVYSGNKNIFFKSFEY